MDAQLGVWADTTGSTMVARPVVTDAGAVRAVQGGLDNPAYSFTASTNSGMVLSAAGTVSFQASTDQCVDVNSTALTACVPILVDGGIVSAPGYSFTANTDTGLYMDAADTIRVSVNNTGVMVLPADTNVTFGSTSGTYGSGEGMLRIADGTAATTAPASGGLLYVNGDDLIFRDTGNTTHTLTASATVIITVGSSTDNGVVRFDTTGGNVVQDTSTVLISDTGEVTVVGAEGYSFTSSATSGLFSAGADTMTLDSAGTTSLSLSTTATTVAAAHVLAGIDGVLSAPSFSFTTSPTTGLYTSLGHWGNPSGVNTVAGATAGTRALMVGATGNVAFGTDIPDFAGGQGVVYLSDVTTVPTTPLANGGLLYTDGTSIFFFNKDAGISQLGGVQSLGSSVDNAITTVTDTAGATLGVSGFTLTSGQIAGVVGSSGTPPYRLGTSGAVGWYLSGGDTIQFAAGKIIVAPTTVNISTVNSDSLRVGGVGGTTDTFSTPTITRNFADVSGSFVWEQNGTPIFQTNSARDVDLLSHFALCTGGTGNFSLGFDGTRFDIDVANAADSLDFSVGGTAMATFTSTGLTCPNVVANSFRSSIFAFSSSPTSGFKSSNRLEVAGKRVVSMSTGGRSGFIVNSVGSGNKCFTLGPAVTAPTSLPTTGSYVYLNGTGFLRAVNKDADVAVNGPVARALISRTQTIATGAIDLIDTLIDDGSNLLVVDTAAPGAGTITGTADTAGMWEISASAQWVSNATGFRRLLIKVGGVAVGEETHNAVTGMEAQQQVRVCVNVAASAVVTFEVEQNSGGNLDVDVRATVVFLG